MKEHERSPQCEDDANKKKPKIENARTQCVSADDEKLEA